MRSVGRWLLVLMLVLGVPLKALAAASGFDCPHGHDTSVVHPAAHDEAAHEHCDGHPAQDAATTVAGHACGACAPCCAAAAPAPEAAAAELAALPPVFESRAVWLASGIVTDVPHKPPR